MCPSEFKTLVADMVVPEDRDAFERLGLRIK